VGGEDGGARYLTMLQAAHNVRFGLGENMKHADLAHLARAMRLKRLPKKVGLFAKGQRGSQLALVLTGGLHALNGDGRRVSVDVGQVLGVTALLSMEYSDLARRQRDVISTHVRRTPPSTQGATPTRP
jgi:hypothetical protein